MVPVTSVLDSARDAIGLEGYRHRRHALSRGLGRAGVRPRVRLVLGTRVRIVRQGERGRIEIDFGSEDELIRLFEQLAEGD